MSVIARFFAVRPAGETPQQARTAPPPEAHGPLGAQARSQKAPGRQRLCLGYFFFISLIKPFKMKAMMMITMTTTMMGIASMGKNP